MRPTSDVVLLGPVLSPSLSESVAVEQWSLSRLTQESAAVVVELEEVILELLVESEEVPTFEMTVDRDGSRTEFITTTEMRMMVISMSGSCDVGPIACLDRLLAFTLPLSPPVPDVTLRFLRLLTWMLPFTSTLSC